MSSYSNAKIIFGLNTLIKLNEKRIRYYKVALEKSDDVELILWFNRYGSHLQKANEVLGEWLRNYHVSNDSFHKSPELTSHWDQLKDIFILNKKSALLQHCSLLERNALKVYRTAVALLFVPSAAITDIQDQIEDIEEALRSLHNLKENQSRQLQVA